jgi:Zn-dependent protease
MTLATPAAPERGVSAVFLLLAAAFAISASVLAAGDATGIAVFAFVLLGWIVSLCLHEFGHAIVAYWGGDNSVVGRGYLTLNPLRYVNPLMSIGLPLLFLALGGIGFPGGAVYLQPQRLRSPLWRAATSAAGPAMNFLFLVMLGAIFSAIDAIERSSFGAALALLAFLQATALVINLLPIPGLDGFGILEAALPREARVAVARVSGFALIAFLAVMLAAPGLLRPLFIAAAELCRVLGVEPGAAAEGYRLFRFWETS